MTTPLTSTEWAGFVHAIRFTPDDDTVRLVAADWLQETNLPELVAWADFIRYQIEAATSPRSHVYGDSCDCGACRPERRAVALFDRWGSHWTWHQFGHTSQDMRNMAKMKHGSANDYSRGFVKCVTLTVKNWRVADLPKDISPLYDLCPLPVLVVYLRDGMRLRGIADSWDIRVEQRVHRPKWMNVIAEIMPFPLVAGQRSTRATRIVDRKNDFARNVRGAVRQAVIERRGCLERDHVTAGTG